MHLGRSVFQTTRLGRPHAIDRPKLALPRSLVYKMFIRLGRHFAIGAACALGRFKRRVSADPAQSDQDCSPSRPRLQNVHSFADKSDNSCEIGRGGLGGVANERQNHSFIVRQFGNVWVRSWWLRHCSLQSLKKMSVTIDLRSNHIYNILESDWLRRARCCGCEPCMFCEYCQTFREGTAFAARSPFFESQHRLVHD